MKPKFILLFLVIVCLLSFVGCNSNQKMDSETTGVLDAETTSANNTEEETTSEIIKPTVTVKVPEETTQIPVKDTDDKITNNNAPSTDNTVETTASSQQSSNDTTSSNNSSPNSNKHTHKYGEWKTVKTATCTTDGTQERACSCGKKETKNIAKSGHTIVIDKSVPPSCTATGLTEGSHCSVCKTKIKNQEILSKVEHLYVKEYCSYCSAPSPKQQEIISENERHLAAVTSYTEGINENQHYIEYTKEVYNITTVLEADYCRGLIKECNTLISNLRNSISHHRLQEEWYGEDRSSQIRDCEKKIELQREKIRLYEQHIDISEYQEKIEYYQSALESENTLHKNNLAAIEAKYNN